MKAFAITASLVGASITAIFYFGSQPERRYADNGCQYRMIYSQEAGQEAGLLTIGGSRMLVATSGRHFNDILKEAKPDARPVYNMSHSIFTLEKEYFLLRDFLERHSLKTALIMIEPRRKDFGSIHEDAAMIARLSDIPITVRALWPEDPIQSLVAARDVVVQHLKVTERPKEPHEETSLHDCDRLDYRLDIEGLNVADVKYRTMGDRRLEWDLSLEEEQGFLKWMDAFHDLKAAHDFELFFLVMTGMSEPLPPPGFETDFRQATGHKLIVLDDAIQAKLSNMGRRDSSHINEKGRDMFLPWLIDRIDAGCERPDGCF